MSSVVISGNTSGTITLDAPAVAGTTTLTLPATSGTVLTSASTITPSTGTVTQASLATGVAGTGPAFAAYQSTGVALTAGTFTKITFQTEEYDTNSNFASSRFTPTVAGYYQINGAWQFGSGGTVTVCAIYKNGTIYKQGASTGGTAGYGGTVSSLVYFNGSSDYVELYGYASSAKTPLATVDATYFNGALVRGA